VAGAGSRVRLDLNSPEFQDVFFRLDAAQVNQVVASLRRLRQLDWSTLYQHSGFRWEAIEHLKAPNGARVYSLRLSQKVRAIAYRDGDFLRLISLHPDHDSAYER
jgi:UDP-3-O-acyl-N-acetylglucosamine deacetylase